MTSPFLDISLARGLLAHERREAVPVSYRGVESVLGVERVAVKGIPLYRALVSVVDSFLAVPEESADVDEILAILDAMGRRYQVDKISVRVGFARETALEPTFARRLARASDPMARGFRPDVVGYWGVVDLSVPFGKYVGSLKWGPRAYFLRADKRSLYQTDVASTGLKRGEFDRFVARLREHYRQRGYPFTFGPNMQDTLFREFARGRALLLSVTCAEQPAVRADVLVLYDGTDAYYYAGARSPGEGILQGVGYYAQIQCVRYLAEMGLQGYSLGWVNEDPAQQLSDQRVRQFKKSLATDCVPVTHLYRASPRAAQIDRILRALRRGTRRLEARGFLKSRALAALKAAE